MAEGRGKVGEIFMVGDEEAIFVVMCRITSSSCLLKPLQREEGKERRGE